MSYIGPKDFSADAGLIAEVMRVMSGDLRLDWMKDCPHPIAMRPKQAQRGLTLDDINDDPHYGPSALPEIIRDNFSMTPRGGVLPEGLPSLGYRVNRKSDVWADSATALFEESKSRRWAPARNVPWDTLDEAPLSSEQDRAIRQLCTGLTSIGLVSTDVPSRWVWLINQDFHEIKYWMCTQMFDATRLAEAFRKRALYGQGALGCDSRKLCSAEPHVIFLRSEPRTAFRVLVDECRRHLSRNSARTGRLAFHHVWHRSHSPTRRHSPLPGRDHQ
jgi:hypothetical protein